MTDLNGSAVAWEAAIVGAIARTEESPPQRKTGRPAGTSEEARAYRDAMRAIAADIPNPAEYAAQLALVYVQALVHARFSLEGWRIDNGFETLAPAMRRGGLVDCRNFCLTAFGIAVRRALMAEGA